MDNVPQQEFDFMLSELTSERSLIDERQRRLEQIIAFYITLATTLVAATVVVTQLQGKMAFILFLISCLALSIIGHICWLASMNIEMTIIISRNNMFIRRQFFLDSFPSIKKCIDARDKKEIRDNWHTQFGCFCITLKKGTVQEILVE